MRLLQDEACSYYIDWEIIGAEGGNALHLLNPFDPAPREAENWIDLLGRGAGRNSRRARADGGP